MRKLTDTEKERAKVKNSVLLKSANWTLIHKRALGYAWTIENRNRNIVLSHTAEDVVQVSIERIYKQIRFWDRRKTPDLLRFTFKVIRSEFYNEIRKLYDLREAKRDARFDQEFVPNPTELLEQRQFLALNLSRFEAEYPGLYHFYLQCDQLGLFDGRKKSEVADALGMTRSAFSKKKKKMIDILMSWQNDDVVENIVHIQVQGDKK